MSSNIDEKVVTDFGREWSKFDQSNVPMDELKNIFDQYFSLFPWDDLPHDAVGFDLGCGSGRWAYFCASRVGKLHCIDPAEQALTVAKNKLAKFDNCIFHNTGVDDIPVDDNSMDFGYSLGVLHHIPDTQQGIKSCVSKLKPGAPFLLYLYYALDNKPLWFRTVWRISDIFRKIISILPSWAKYPICQLIAILVYFPLSRLSRFLEILGFNVQNIPLSAYRDKDFNTLKTDALDRFGTRLEKRFTKSQIEEMMVNARLERIKFRDREPFWCAIGYKNG